MLRLRLPIAVLIRPGRHPRPPPHTRLPLLILLERETQLLQTRTDLRPQPAASIRRRLPPTLGKLNQQRRRHLFPIVKPLPGQKPLNEELLVEEILVRRDDEAV